MDETSDMRGQGLNVTPEVINCERKGKLSKGVEVENMSYERADDLKSNVS
jgi:hypothetical protein